MRVVNMTVKPISKAIIVVLLMTTMLVAGTAEEGPKRTKRTHRPVNRRRIRKRSMPSAKLSTPIRT